ncbi:hypothetical protein CSA56_13080 [candidate division KSB3 bacterium]|uniref:Uncharacterized protein n=1 Tax=candidate division KSB3 bacterium TaxID=2044937 RepID=A0A2G6KDR4_9BACT|nr:MAG: hypothetical protein CSA56_13080 [candidate division KSB3 bacterium]
MRKVELVNAHIRQLREELVKINSSMLHEFPIDRYIQSVESYRERYRYNYIAPTIKSMLNDIQARYNAHALALYHKLTLSSLIKRSIPNLNRNSFPESISDLYQEWFDRVLGEFSTLPDEYYSHQNDEFLKDLAGCSLRIIPIGGAWIVEISGIGRRFLLTGGFQQFIKGGWFALMKMGGFASFYQIHVVKRYLHGFNPEERIRCYLRISELLRQNPRIRGMFGESWYYDPTLRDISPRLLYLREIAEQCGAKVFRLGTSQSDIDNALAKSATRRRLYREKVYTPAAYLLIWPRKALMKWAETQRAADHSSAINTPHRFRERVFSLIKDCI